MTATQLATKPCAPASPFDAAGLPPNVLEKIRLRRRKVADLHGAVLARMAEARSLREHLGGLKIEIATLKDSWEFREGQREMRNEYLFPRDPEARDNPPPARGGKKTPKAAQDLADLEHDLETTATELKIAAAAQTAASERWATEKTGLDAWERAARSQSPAARALIDALPAAHSGTATALAGQVDFRLTAHGIAAQMTR